MRLETLGRDDQVQATMVATWLLELLLDKQNRAALGASEDTGEGAGAGGASELEQARAVGGGGKSAVGARGSQSGIVCGDRCCS